MSDWALYRCMEKNLVQCSAAPSFQISKYLRYRDDVLCFAEDESDANIFINRLQSAAGGVWELELDVMSWFCVPMLDVLLLKKDDAGVTTIGYKPYVKPTARHVPLHPDSTHEPSIHRSWPLGEVSRFYKTSSSRKYFDERKDIFIRRLRHNFFDQSVLNSCIAWRFQELCQHLLRSGLPVGPELLG